MEHGLPTGDELRGGHDTGQFAQISHDLKTVLRVSQAMSLERNLGSLLDLIVTAAADLVNADRCSLFVVDAEADELWTRVAQGSDEIRLPMGSGIVGSVARSGAVINIPDAYQDDRFNPENDRRTGYRTTSILCLPLINHEGTIVGALQALNKRVDRRRLRNRSERVRLQRAQRHYERLLQEEQVRSGRLARAQLNLALAAFDYGDDDQVFVLLDELEARADLSRRLSASVRTLRARAEHTRSGLEQYITVPFTMYDEEVLAALCSQAAVAIDNTQLIAHDLERQQLIRELDLARDIQAGLLPEAPPELPGWRFVAWYDPCDQTSGDYYDYVCHDQGLCDVVVGDVTGHGIGAALMMSTARAFLQSLYRHRRDLSGILEELNALLEQDMADDVFMTMCITRLHPDGHISYASAGHEAPQVYRLAEDRFDELPEGGLMLGALEDCTYEESEASALAPGDLMLQFTDGIFEAIGGSDDEAFGVERLRAVVRAHARSGAAGVATALQEALAAHMDGQASQDDLTLVVVERC